MFMDCLELIFDSLSDVIDALKVDLFTYGNVGISLWELILGMLIVSIIFSFFLKPRAGSVFGTVSAFEYAKNAREQAERRIKERADREAERKSY